MKLKESNRKGKTVGDGWSESSVKRSSTKKIFFSLLTQSMYCPSLSSFLKGAPPTLCTHYSC